jgi:hypothetical protein
MTSLNGAALRLLVIVAVTACGDGTGPDSEITTSGPSFADITRDGDAWVAETRFYFRVGDYLSVGFDRPIPKTPQGEGIVFLVPGFAEEGSYRLGRVTDSTPAAGYGVVDASTNSGWGVNTTDSEPGPPADHGLRSGGQHRRRDLPLRRPARPVQSFQHDQLPGLLPEGSGPLVGSRGLLGSLNAAVGPPHEEACGPSVDDRLRPCG